MSSSPAATSWCATARSPTAPCPGGAASCRAGPTNRSEARRPRQPTADTQHPTAGGTRPAESAPRTTPSPIHHARVTRPKPEAVRWPDDPSSTPAQPIPVTTLPASLAALKGDTASDPALDARLRHALSGYEGRGHDELVHADGQARSG